MLAIDLDADVLAIVTDVDAVYEGWGTPEQRAIRRATPESLAASEFAAGSMGPKVHAACQFVERTGKVGGDRLDRRRARRSSAARPARS